MAVEPKEQIDGLLGVDTVRSLLDLVKANVHTDCLRGVSVSAILW